MATSIDDNAADENLYKLFGEMSVIQYTRMPTDCSALCAPTYEQAHVGLDFLTLASYIHYNRDNCCNDFGNRECDPYAAC